jgi:hypothetical protein
MSGAAFQRWQVIAPEDGRRPVPATHSAPASPSTFSRALIGLLSRLWLELERIIGGSNVFDTRPASSSAENQMELFRLEVLVLLDACDSLRWQSLMSPQQCLELRATLRSLLRTLSGASDAPDSDVIGEAQNQLFDSLQHHLERAPHSRWDGAGCNRIAII